MRIHIGNKLRSYSRAGIIILLLVILFTSCQSVPSKGDATPVVEIPIEVSTPTPEPQKDLTICMAREPASLYLYASPTESAWSILEAVYDGPIDLVNFQPSPVILQKLPTVKNGDASIKPVVVTEGDPVVDVNGDLAALRSGLTVLPSGCLSNECAVTWDGSTELKMDQLTASFKVLEGVLWSDGTPVTAEDSVFSYQIASDPATLVNRFLIERTFAYSASDAQTVVWTGIPGYIDSSFAQNFFIPLPKHAWAELSPADLISAPESTEMPLGWGPFVINEWVKGDHITLTKNPNYFRAAEGLPYFNTITYKFFGTQADNNLAALKQGDCDLVDPSAGLEAMLEHVLDAQKAGDIKAYVGQGPVWEEILFNIFPASYADGNSPLTGDRPDFFGDVRTRRAIAMCMDRSHAVNKQLLEQSTIPDGFLPPSHPLAAQGLSSYVYDPESGARLLDEVGWKDVDGNPSTPRVAYSIPGVQDGTQFQVTYLVTGAYLRQEVVKVLVESAADCGIQINVKTSEPEELYASAPDGILFGRKFDMAQIAWQAGPNLPCGMFTTADIPNPANQWMGINLGGYSNPVFDSACSTALASSPDSPAYQESNTAVQKLFADELPAIPLYFHLKIAATSPDFCGLDMDVSSRSALRSIESFKIGQNCP
jgi:peptide/nickel transport system substrate-binding protein